MKPSRILSALVFLIVVLLAAWFHSQGGLPLDPAELRLRIAELGWVAPFGFMAIAALRPVLGLPSVVVMTSGGLAFGFVGGTLLSSLGFSLGAVLWFGLARALGRDAVQKRMGDRLTRADAFLSNRGPKWLGAYTALPVSVLTPVHAGAGLSSMSFLAFATWVSLGLIPRSALYSFFGDSLTRGTAAAVAAGIVLAVIVIVALFVMRRMFAGTSEESGASTQPSTRDPGPHSTPPDSDLGGDT